MEKPSLEKYGLNEEIVRNIISVKCEYEQTRNKISFRILLSVFVLAFLIIYNHYNDFWTTLGIVIAFGLPIAFCGCLIIFPLLAPIYLKGIKTEKFLKYETLYQSYLKETKAYEEYLTYISTSFWRSLTGLQFEHAIANLCQKLNYDVTLTPPSRDEGVDVILREKTGTKKIIVQCKAHSNPVGPAIARDLYGSLFHHKADEAWLIALAGVTSGVKEFIKDKPIKVFALNDIIEMYKKVYGSDLSQLNNLKKIN